MPMPTTVEAITARMLELGHDLAFAASLHGDTPDTLEYADLEAQLKTAKAEEEANA